MKRFTLLAAAVLVSAAAMVAVGGADPGDSLDFTNVATANASVPGVAPADKLSPEVHQVVVAQGSTALENPNGVITHYGYETDVPNFVPTASSPTTEAQKTEPDKNTYLVFKNGLHGADPNYDYGSHFLVQGHEAGVAVTLNPPPFSGTVKQSYITRINLDADAAHRVTLLAYQDEHGLPLQTIDGSTWDPWAQKLLFTTENTNAPTYAAGADYPTTVEDLSGSLGRGGYEGIQDDGDGNIWIVEDIGGSPNKKDAAGSTTTAKPANSFIYRYVPKTPGDLHNGKLQVLQVLNANGDPITFASQAALNNPDQVALHSYGKSFKTNWITIHDTATDGTAPFVANTLAKAATANGTPFKRPENGVFRPGTRFGEFYFTETGDTNASSPENPNGGWGSVFKVTQSSPSDNHGRISVFFKGDQAHTGLDNITFLSRNQFSAVEDAGAGLHTARGLDSGWVFDATVDYSTSGNVPVRWLAQGRDASATLDAAASPVGFGRNEDDNEITGIHVSNGDPGVNGILGAKAPKLGSGHGEWRWFYTRQHGDNPTFEVVYEGSRKDDSDH
jgi:hypothetical protein